MNQANALPYTPALHNVRRVNKADQKNGWKLRPGTFMAADGSWNRKAVVLSVSAACKRGLTIHTCHSRYDYPDFVGYTCRVMTVGRYWATGKYRAAKRASVTTVTVWFNAKGEIVNTVSGLIPVLPV